jgi:DNA polymerase (family 10)
MPRLVETANIRGDLHLHTTASDGINTIKEMIEACRSRGYSCMCISDHSQSQVQANGLDARRLADHAKQIRRIAAEYDDITVWAGIEVDIFKDGSLDFDEQVLSELDFVTASPHSALRRQGPAATDRIVRAIQHPCVHCIGHPSGRLINRRPGMELEIDTIAAAAAENATALEINANDHRLDLRDRHVRIAVEAGAKIVINTDAHSVEELDLMTYGVLTARRGWATTEAIVNTWPVEKILRWISTGSKR